MLGRLAALAAAAALSTSPVHGANTDENDPAQSATVADPIQPIRLIEMEDIDLSGLRSVWDLLQQRSDYNSFGIHRALVLGNEHAVFLVNGRQIPNPRASYALESLPVSAVERIEILPQGAAGPTPVRWTVEGCRHRHWGER